MIQELLPWVSRRFNSVFFLLWVLHIVNVLFATGGGDYTAGPYNVTFPAGQITVSAEITINDDNILEGNETFTIEIDLSSLPTSVTVGGTSQTTVVIDNDDCKLIIIIIITSV